MINKKNIIAIAILAGLSFANNGFANDLTQMDIKKSGTSDTIDVTLYTTNPTVNSVVSRKNANRYVLLLPNTNSSSSVVPSLGGVKDLISNVDVKHVNDGIGGYTKVTFDTIKPVNFKTYSKKSTAVASTTNYKPIIAASNAAKPITVQPTKTTTGQTPVKAAAKPIAKTTSTNKIAETVKTPKIESKEAKVPIAKPNIVNIVKQKIQPITKPTNNTNTKQQNTPSKKVKPVVAIQTANTPTTVKTNKKPVIDLEPKVNHDIVKSNFYKNDNVEQTNTATQPVDDTIKKTTKPTKNITTPINNQQVPTKSHNGIIPIAFAALAGGLILYKKKKSKKNIPVSVTNKLAKDNVEGTYSQIVDNIELNWQEKFKMYAKSSNNIVKKVADKGNVTYVADIKNKNAKLTHVVKVDKKISELAIKKMPTIENKINGIDVSKMINHNMELPKLKSFANPMQLNESVNSKIANNTHKELPHTERLPKLKASLNNALRKSTKYKETYDNRLLTIGKDKGEYMSKEEQKYVLSSLNEYLSILDKNKSDNNTSNSIKNVSAGAGMSNPIASSSRLNSSNPFKGMIVKSGYCINESKGFYLVNMNGTSALIGKNGNDTYVLKKFNSIVDSELQVRPDGMDVYMVKAGRYKCLVDVSKNKMGTLIEI